MPEKTWYDLLDACLENFDSSAQLSMSRVFSRLIVSHAALANRAYEFFDLVYGRAQGGDVRHFVDARTGAVRMLGHLLVLKLVERGVGSTAEVHSVISEQVIFLSSFDFYFFRFLLLLVLLISSSSFCFFFFF